MRGYGHATKGQQTIVCCGFCAYIIIAIACSINCFHSVTEIENIDINSANQLIEQWAQPFITDVKVVASHENCDE